MKAHDILEGAPLVYTVGMVRFPRLFGESITRVLDGFHHAIRAQGYPLRDEAHAKILNAVVGPEGFRVEEKLTKINQFSDLERTWAFILSDEVFCLHTSRYETGPDYVKRFEVGLRALEPVLSPDVNLVEAIGVRYVNLVVPEEGETLSDYLEPWALPMEAPRPLGGMPFEVTESMYVVSCRSEVGNMRLQALRRPPTTLPLDLDTHIIQINNWKRPLPVGRDFAVLDTDHGRRFDVPQSFSVAEVASQIGKLCSTVGDWFLAAGTDHAKRVWSKKR